jgi:putative peptidoglycan lipid II flippase
VSIDTPTDTPADPPTTLPADAPAGGPGAARRETERVARAAGTIGVYTLLSRLLGFVRDMVLARLFGASVAADAFFVAFRIPNLFRELLAEGTMSAAFVPVFTEKLATGDRDGAWALASRVFTLLLMILVAVVALGVAAAPLVVRVIAPGFAHDPGQEQLTVLLTRIMFPYLLFIGLSALAMGILNAHRAFALPALAPFCFNLALISAALWLAPAFAEPAVGLAMGVVAGGAAQLLLQVPGLWRKRMIPRPVFAPRDRDVRRIGRLMLPVVFGLSVTQVNLLVNTLLASLLATGSVSYLYYGMRLIQFPLGVFGVALATAILPSLSTQAARGELHSLQAGVADALRLVAFITVPAMAGLIALRLPIISVLFQRGAFDAAATHGVAIAVVAYAAGLWAFAAVRIVAATFYALQDTTTPVRAAAIAMAVNVALNLALIRPLGHGGLALATSLSAMLNLTLLVYALRTRLAGLALAALWPSLLRTCAAALLLGLGCAWAATLPLWEGGSLLARAAWLAATVAGFGMLYLTAHRALGGEEVALLARALARRRRPPGG